MKRLVIAAGITLAVSMGFVGSAEAKRYKAYHAERGCTFGDRIICSGKQRYYAQKRYYSKKRYAVRTKYYAKTQPSKNIFQRYASHGSASASINCLTPATRAMWDRLKAQFPNVKPISTCRPGATIAGSGRPSYHRYGMAVDLNAGRNKRAVVAWLRRQRIFVMTYASMSHVHFNLGQVGYACGGCGSKYRTRYAKRHKPRYQAYAQYYRW